MTSRLSSATGHRHWLHRHGLPSGLWLQILPPYTCKVHVPPAGMRDQRCMYLFEMPVGAACCQGCGCRTNTATVHLQGVRDQHHSLTFQLPAGVRDQRYKSAFHLPIGAACCQGCSCKHCHSAPARFKARQFMGHLSGCWCQWAVQWMHAMQKWYAVCSSTCIIASCCRLTPARQHALQRACQARLPVMYTGVGIYTYVIKYTCVVMLTCVDPQGPHSPQDMGCQQRFMPQHQHDDNHTLVHHTCTAV